MKLSFSTIYFAINILFISILFVCIYFLIKRKYIQPEQIDNISKKYNIISPKYLLFYLDHYNTSPSIYNLVCWFKRIPKISDSPTLYLSKAVRSIKNRDDKKIYIEWLINQLSMRISRSESDSNKDFYRSLRQPYIKFIIPNNEISNSLILDDASIVEYAINKTCKGKGPNCPEVLKKYVEQTANFPEMNKLEIFNDEDDFGNKIEDLTTRPTYYEWVKEFEENRENLKRVTEISEKEIRD